MSQFRWIRLQAAPRLGFAEAWIGTPKFAGRGVVHCFKRTKGDALDGWYRRSDLGDYGPYDTREGAALMAYATGLPTTERVNSFLHDNCEIAR